MAIPEISDGVEEKIVGLMCLSSAAAIQRQCGREYGFADGEDLHVTDISSLSSKELHGLPTNNCISERDLPNLIKKQ